MLTVELGRRQFLCGELYARKSPMRPPWALPEAEFAQRCTRCGACQAACPQSIIERGSGSYPQLNFARNGCSFRGECVVVCEPGALRRKHPNRGLVWPWVAEVGLHCLSCNGVVCRQCGESCEPRAIQFRPQIGGKAMPVIDSQVCTGCGSCVGICPVGAISMEHRQHE